MHGVDVKNGLKLLVWTCFDTLFSPMFIIPFQVMDCAVKTSFF